jgi:protein-histidine N-methyltransferase
MISFTEMDLPFETTGCKLYRRDLYDARFQVIDEMPSDDEEDHPSAAEAQEDQDTATYVNADTDLIPGTYEGGLKTWEGGMDLVEVLEEQHRRIPGGVGSWARGKRILEVSSSLAPAFSRD